MLTIMHALLLLSSYFAACWSLALHPVSEAQRNIDVEAEDECTESGCDPHQTLAQQWRKRHHVFDDQIPSVETCHRTVQKTGRVALILQGDSFRNSNNQLENTTCDESSVKSQVINARSHMEFISSLESAGYVVRVFGATYPCSNGADLAANLPSYYGNHMETFRLMPRSDAQFGGQVYAISNATGEAVASIQKSEDEFEYYIIWRWDLRMVHIENTFWPCLFDSKPFVKNLFHIYGMTTSGPGSDDYPANIDWVMTIPGQTVRCFLSAVYEDPQNCCSFRDHGPACILCADNMNQRFFPEEYSPCLNESPSVCPAAASNCTGLMECTKAGAGQWE